MKPLLTWLLFAAFAAARTEHFVVLGDDTQYSITPWLHRLRSGDLIVTAREAHRRKRPFLSHADPTARGILLRSSDGGRSWGGKIVLDDETCRFSQTEDVPVTELSDGTLLLNLYAWAASPRYLYQSVSEDDGKIFSKPVKTAMWGYPAHLLERRDGRILCTYGYRREPCGLRAVLSRDGGRTWDFSREIVLRDDGSNGGLGYPSAAGFEDGRVLLVYWFNQEKPGDPSSEVR
jgi:hypothetical protein